MVQASITRSLAGGRRTEGLQERQAAAATAVGAEQAVAQAGDTASEARAAGLAHCQRPPSHPSAIEGDGE